MRNDNIIELVTHVAALQLAVALHVQTDEVPILVESECKSIITRPQKEYRRGAVDLYQLSPLQHFFESSISLIPSSPLSGYNLTLSVGSQHGVEQEQNTYLVQPEREV